MRDGLKSLHDMARTALAEVASTTTLDDAAAILHAATGANEVLIVYAQDDEFLLARAGEPPPLNDISQNALRVVQRNLMSLGSPIAFNLMGSHVVDFHAASADDEAQYLAFHVPTTEGSSEMCLLRAPWPRSGEQIVPLVESALPSLTLLLDRALNAERQRRHKHQLEALSNAAQILSRAEDMAQALTDLASSISVTTGFDYVSIDVYDVETERFTLRVLNQNRWANTSLAQAWVQAFNPERPDELAASILRTREPAITADLQHSDRMSEGLRVFFKRALLTSGALFPLLFQDELQGTMSFVSYRPQTFPPEQVALLEGIASQMATALKAMRMYNELSQSREETERHVLRIERQQRKLKRQAARLREMASTDALTGAVNYGRLHELMDHHVARAQQNELPLSIILADVDNFKLFNDTYGHLAGDDALREVVGALRTACRRSDVIGRYGGDEFMIILPKTDKKGASHVAQRILDALSEQSLRPPTATERLPLELAIGIATYPDDGTTKDALIGHADAAMYEAKGLLQRKMALGIDDDGRDPVEYPVSAFGLLDGLVRAIDRRDHYTKTHSEHDAEYAVMMGRAIGLSPDALRALRIAGLLHDVGKIGIPDRILRKPGLLTEEERTTMEQHVLLAERIIGGVPHLEEVVEAAGSHHERFDGTGYPRGLKGEEIPLLGRLLAVADAFSAMTEDRPYRKALSPDDAIRQLRDCAGTQFDPAFIDVFINEVLPQLEQRKEKAA